MRSLLHRFQSRKRRKGNFLMEFALVTPILMLLLTGSTDYGLILTATNQISQVCRNANVLTVRSVDLSKSQNQQLLLRTAQGLGMNITGTYNPDPNGKGVIILTRVMMVGNNQCSLGISNWDGKQSSCPNYGQYVIANRIWIGNKTKWKSPIGDPASTLQSDGDLLDSDIAQVTGNRAKGFGSGGIITLSPDQFTYVSEVYVDVRNLDVFHLIQNPIVFMRNLS